MCLSLLPRRFHKMKAFLCLTFLSYCLWTAAVGLAGKSCGGPFKNAFLSKSRVSVSTHHPNLLQSVDWSDKQYLSWEMAALCFLNWTRDFYQITFRRTDHLVALNFRTFVLLFINFLRCRVLCGVGWTPACCRAEADPEFSVLPLSAG